MNGLSSISCGAFTALVSATAGQGQWYALVVTAQTLLPRVAELLHQELLLLLEDSPAPAGPVVERLHGAAALARFTPQITPAPLVVTIDGLEQTSTADWENLNFLRSRLVGDFSLVFLLSPAALLRLQEHAPDLDALLRSSTWQMDPQAEQLSAPEREGRLQALREETGLNDDEVLARAERRELPADPHFAEWLTLLGRGDLLEPR